MKPILAFTMDVRRKKLNTVLYTVLAVVIFSQVFPSSILAQDSVIHFDSSGETHKRVSIAIPEFVQEESSKDPSGLGIELRKILESELNNSEQFNLIDSGIDKKTALLARTPSAIEFNSWSQMGAQWLLKTNYRINPQDESFNVTFRLYEVATQQFLLGKRYTATKKFFRRVMQQIAEAIALLSYAEPPVSGKQDNDALAVYIGVVHKKVFENWHSPSVAQAYNNEVTISFNIYPQGHIGQPVFKSSSQVELLDDLALNAILDSRPFPPFPKEIKSSDLNVNIHFKYIPENSNQARAFLPVPSETFVDVEILGEERKLEEENSLTREQSIESLVKSVENRKPADKGFGYKDFYFGDSFDLVEGLKRKHCSSTERPFMKGNFNVKFDQSININETKTLDGWCFNRSKFMHFLFKDDKLTRMIWEVSATPDSEGVLPKYQRLREQLTSANEYRLTKTRSSDTLKRAKGQSKTTLIDEFDDGGLLLVLDIERIQTEIYAIYQDKDAANNYSRTQNKDYFWPPSGCLNCDPR
jgi:TonB family protein